MILFLLFECTVVSSTIFLVQGLAKLRLSSWTQIGLKPQIEKLPLRFDAVPYLEFPRLSPV